MPVRSADRQGSVSPRPPKPTSIQPVFDLESTLVTKFGDCVVLTAAPSNADGVVTTVLVVRVMPTNSPAEHEKKHPRRVAGGVPSQIS